MPSYIGIDLGTTNSVIASYDGETQNVTLYKSPEQNDVTPSAIYFDKRGSRYYGARAYKMAAAAPDATAVLFKRLMGTSTPIHIGTLKLTPEDCSAEILKVLFGYLPEDMRNSKDTGTVITVPAAFNQMQKDATLAAAQMAGLGKVALMQEPVAAVMSVMRTRKQNGMFLIFDLGGGTLDVALAESLSGRVNLLEHGGVAMCGGRDWDRSIVDNVVKPWLLENFALPEKFSTDARYAHLVRLASWAAELAKIELSAREASTISLPDVEVRTKDDKGEDIYLDVPLDRGRLNDLITPRVEEAVQAARDVIERAHLTAPDLERIVFVGGPTQYKPLRDRIATELGIPGSTEVNPMTAVAEGAAIFAESVDWDSVSRGRKSGRGTVAASHGKVEIGFAYESRTHELKASLRAQVKGQLQPGSTFQIDSIDSGWSSGRIPLREGAALTLPLSKNGENRFKVFVFDPAGGAIPLANDLIAVTRTAATVEAIPASHSIGVAAKERIGGPVVLDYLVRKGDPLPRKGQRTFRAEESLRAGSSGILAFQLWEGEIDDPYRDNRLIGCMRITGSDFDEGVIPAGADLKCAYEVGDSGNIEVTITIPSIGGSFGEGHNFYSRQEGQIDYSQAADQVSAEVDEMLGRIDEIATQVQDPRLDAVRQGLQEAKNTVTDGEPDPESCKKAMDGVVGAKQQLAKVRKDRLSEIRAVELRSFRVFFEEDVRQHAKPAEDGQIQNLLRAAERLASETSGGFESRLREARQLCFQVLWRQDWFVANRLEFLSKHMYQFVDQEQARQLVAAGRAAAKKDDFAAMRAAVGGLYALRRNVAGAGDAMDDIRIVKGH